MIAAAEAFGAISEALRRVGREKGPCREAWPDGRACADQPGRVDLCDGCACFAGARVVDAVAPLMEMAE